MVSWEDLALAIGGFTPVIAVGAVIGTQELSKSSSHSSGHADIIVTGDEKLVAEISAIIPFLEERRMEIRQVISTLVRPGVLRREWIVRK